MMQSFANATCKMHVSGGHQRHVGLFLHRHDAFERVLGPFAFFLVVYEIHDSVAMRKKEHSLQGKITCRKMVMLAMACRTGFLMCTCRCFHPLPAPCMKHRAALRTYGRLRQLSLQFISIMHTLLEDTVMALDLTEAGGNSIGVHYMSP